MVSMKNLFCIAIMAMLGVSSSAVADKSDYLMPEMAPAPKDNQTTTERVQLGKALFFDPRLSSSNWKIGRAHV